MPTATATTSEETLHAVIIAAAIAALLDHPHRILSTRRVLTSPAWTQQMLTTWSVEGRSTIFSSHKVR